MNNPIICIAFNAGAAGDFLTSLVHQQIVDNFYQLKIDDTGKVINQVASEFKDRCKLYYQQQFQTNLFENLTLPAVANTHFCSRKLIDIFPNTKFYYIDDSDYALMTFNHCIKKRWDGHIQQYWKNNYTSLVNKYIKLTDDQVKKVFESRWQKNVNKWQQLNLTKIKFEDILDIHSCKNIVQSMMATSIDSNLFTQSYITWTNKNSTLMEIKL